MKYFLLSTRIVVAAILLQTLFFKFTGAEESVFIFSSLGAEPWGRWLSGFAELAAAVLLLIPATQLFGALVSLMIISGAILSHLLILGIIVQNDGGLLFGLAVTVFIGSLMILFFNRQQLVQKIMAIKSKYVRKQI
ncbi:MAG: DoxX family protein [Bdellovibrionales bacterium]|nr:DoxX family protein [Bdellovibrionales bacterium]